MGFINSMGSTLANWFGVPPDFNPKSITPMTSDEDAGPLAESDYVSVILDITSDDIAIGTSPVSVVYDVETPKEIGGLFYRIRDEFNRIVKWSARDLCKTGYSAYYVVKTGVMDICFMPITRKLDFYISKLNKLVVKDGDKVLENIVVFLYYDKDALKEIEDADLMYSVTPVPMQLKNAQPTMDAIASTEAAIVRYRKQLSRVLRWVNVDVGVSQGDGIQQTIDKIDSSINANSIDLAIDGSYDDAIPVIPNRRGVGRPEIVSDIPNVEIKSLTDLEYLLSKLNLLMRFPASYMDFSKEMGETAVSMIRSDLRYAKLCASVQAVIERTMNDFVNESPELRQYEPEFKLTKFPTSEDDDVIQAVGDYVDMSSRVDEFLSGDNPSEAIHKLDLLQSLFKSCVSAPAIDDWFVEYRTYLMSQLTGGEENTDSDGTDF